MFLADINEPGTCHLSLIVKCWCILQHFYGGLAKSIYWVFVVCLPGVRPLLRLRKSWHFDNYSLLGLSFTMSDTDHWIISYIHNTIRISWIYESPRIGLTFITGCINTIDHATNRVHSVATNISENYGINICLSCF